MWALYIECCSATGWAATVWGVGSLVEATVCHFHVYGCHHSYIPMYVCVCACVHTHTPVQQSVCLFVHMCARVYTHVTVSLCRHVCV